MNRQGLRRSDCPCMVDPGPARTRAGNAAATPALLLSCNAARCAMLMLVEHSRPVSRVVNRNQRLQQSWKPQTSNGKAAPPLFPSPTFYPWSGSSLPLPLPLLGGEAWEEEPRGIPSAHVRELHPRQCWAWHAQSAPALSLCDQLRLCCPLLAAGTLTGPPLLRQRVGGG